MAYLVALAVAVAGTQPLVKQAARVRQAKGILVEQEHGLVEVVGGQVQAVEAQEQLGGMV
jgi:hypothetical protein